MSKPSDTPITDREVWRIGHDESDIAELARTLERYISDVKSITDRYRIALLNISTMQVAGGVSNEMSKIARKALEYGYAPLRLEINSRKPSKP